jgi:hypothetical protein
MAPEILYALGAAILVAALAWGVMRAGRLKPSEKQAGETVAKQHYERNEG